MVEVTKINGVKVLINPDLLELVEETPVFNSSEVHSRGLIKYNTKYNQYKTNNQTQN